MAASARGDRAWWVLVVVSTSTFLWACDPRATDATYWERAAIDGETAGDGGGRGSASATSTGTGEGGPTTSTSTGAETPPIGVRFETASYGGEYAPDNVGAAWIARPDGAFVRTLETWGSKRLENVVAWREASGENEVDAVTGATRREHGLHELAWDVRDAGGVPVEPGPLVLHLEVTEDDSAEGQPPGPHREVPFLLGADAVDVTPADDEAFRAVVVDVTP